MPDETISIVNSLLLTFVSSLPHTVLRDDASDHQNRGKAGRRELPAQRPSFGHPWSRTKQLVTASQCNVKITIKCSWARLKSSSLTNFHSAPWTGLLVHWASHAVIEYSTRALNLMAYLLRKENSSSSRRNDEYCRDCGCNMSARADYQIGRWDSIQMMLMPHLAAPCLTTISPSIHFGSYWRFMKANFIIESLIDNCAWKP